MIDANTYRLAPKLAGLVFRHLRAPDDYLAMNAIANAMRLAEGEGWSTSDEDFRYFYDHLENCDPATDVMVVERDGVLVGYGRAAWWEGLDGVRVYEPISMPDPAAGIPGLLQAMHATMEARCREVAGGHPPGPKVFQNDAADASVARIGLLLEGGYQPVRYFYTMVRPTLDDLPGMPLPEGLEIREVRPEHLRAIWEAEMEAVRDHWGQGVPTEQQYQAYLDDPVQGDSTLWRVAWDGDQVAGQVRSYINHHENEQYGRKRGWVENIMVRRPWRRRGLARALIAASIPLLRARGMTEGALGVDTENPTGALRIYEACGFVAVSREATYRKPLE